MSSRRVLARERSAAARRAFVAVVGVVLAATQGVAAQRTGGDIIGVSVPAVTRLPDYCADAQGGKSGYNPSNLTPAQTYWAGLMGNAFHHIHHYCWALDNLRKARDPMLTPQARAGLYRAVLSDCNYVIERSPPDFVLLPEIYLRMGQASFARSDIPGALDYFEKSRAAKPDYWPVYIEIAKTNLSFGRRQEAEAALNAGLALLPDEPNLKQALAQLKAAPARAAKAASN